MTEFCDAITSPIIVEPLMVISTDSNDIINPVVLFSTTYFPFELFTELPE